MNVVLISSFLKPAKHDKLTAQLDVAPTILGLLNFNYESKFFGQNVFGIPDEQHRAFIRTYQSLGYIKNGKLIVLDPNQKPKTYQPNFATGEELQIANDQKLTDEAVANYQLASYLYEKGLYQFK